MRGIGEILNKLKGVKQLSHGEYQACCPAHEDKKPSLNLKQEGNTILIKCQAGCSTEAVCESLGYTIADLFIKSDVPLPATPKEPQPKIVCTYDYQDEKGELLYQVVRYEPKSFRQRHKNGSGEWKWDMEGVRRVLYHLPDIMRLSAEDTIVLCEGEKDVDNLWAYGQYATTSPGGANNWKAEYANYLKGKRVVVIPDKDAAGYAYAKDAIHSLINKANEIKVIILPGDNVKDVSDWLEIERDPEKLKSMEQDISILLDPDRPTYQLKDEAIIWNKAIGEQTITFKSEKLSEEKTGIHSRISIQMEYLPLSWSYLNIERSEDRTRLANLAHKSIKSDISKTYDADNMRKDLDAFCAGLWEYHVSSFVPEFMAGDEVDKPLTFLLKPYLIENGGTIVFAPPGRGKSYTALLWAISIDAGCTKFWPVKQSQVLLINLERSKESMSSRIAKVNKVLGLNVKRPLLTLNARGKSLSEVLPACRKAIKQYGVKLIILDSISRAGYGDLNENQPTNRIIDALSGLCPSWMALAHTSRANEDHAYGSIMLDAGADICVQLTSQVNEDALGIGWEITKQNDVGYKPIQIWALEFNEFGLLNLRHPKAYEFPDIIGKRNQTQLSIIMEYVSNLESGDTTATDASEALGIERAIISKIFNTSGKFVQTRKIGKGVYYGVKTDNKTLINENV